MAEEKTAEAKLAEAEAKLIEQTTKLAELEEKLNKIPNNPEHFDKIKKERDEAKKKLKEIEDANAEAKGEFEKLANDRLAELEVLKSEKESLQAEANKWADFNKSEREKILTSIKDEKVKKLAEKFTDLIDLKEFAELNTKPIVNTNNSNHKPDKPEEDKPLINYKTMQN
jgi:DNA repair exonuclease SbcCD ATPase subunit